MKNLFVKNPALVYLACQSGLLVLPCFVHHWQTGAALLWINELDTRQDIFG